MAFKSIEKFTGENNLEYYLERFESVFKVLKIADNLKVHFLLSNLSCDVYEFLADKVKPVKPVNKSFDEICDILKSRYSVKPLEIAENYKFHQRKQRDGESFQDFLDALRSIAKNCEFGDYLEKAVRNQFTFGLKDEKIRAKLLEIRDLNLQTAFNTAVILSANSINEKPIITQFPTNSNRSHRAIKFVPKCVHFNQRLNTVDFRTQKERFLKLPLTEKRKLYFSKNYVEPKFILKWGSQYALSGHDLKIEFERNKSDFKNYISDKYDLHKALNNKIALWQGDITTLEFDAIVNATNEDFDGDGGVDLAIHKAAGHMLKKECDSLNGCEPGGAKITGGYRLPAKYVIHTVGPTCIEDPKLLNSCYEKSLQLMLENGLKTIAFPCISTGSYDFPQVPAASVALREVRNFMERHVFDVDLIVFNLFLDSDFYIYKNLAQIYFPADY